MMSTHAFLAILTFSVRQASALTMRLTIPNSPLKTLFVPGATDHRSYAFFCFTVGSNGQPTYAHGTAQSYWYFQGPVNANRTATLALYAVNAFTGAPITGTMTVQFSSNFQAATAVSISNCVDAQCALWPTSLSDGTPTFAEASNTESICLWVAGEAAVSRSALLDHLWQGAQGVTNICTASNGIVGSFTYERSAAECAADNLPPSCPLLHGSYDGSALSTETGRGLALAVWYDETGKGSNLFIATTATSVRGFYCRAEGTNITLCYAEQYTLERSNSAAECYAHLRMRSYEVMIELLAVVSAIWDTTGYASALIASGVAQAADVSTSAVTVNWQREGRMHHYDAVTIRLTVTVATASSAHATNVANALSPDIGTPGAASSFFRTQGLQVRVLSIETPPTVRVIDDGSGDELRYLVLLLLLVPLGLLIYSFHLKCAQGVCLTDGKPQFDVSK